MSIYNSMRLPTLYSVVWTIDSARSVIQSLSVQRLMKKDGYLKYSRYDNGYTIQKNDVIITNKDVVPRSLQLLVEFNCHNNLEVCASIKSVKYIHKLLFIAL